MRAINYDYQMREARLAESRASKGDGAVIEDERRAARMHKRRASLWAPKTRRLVLAGIKPESLQHSPVARDPEKIAIALTSHWKPIFGAKL
eukprot:7087971-Pyramimonas_sp.AAC.1